MPFKFSKRSRKNLEGVHPDIVAVMELALSRTDVDFTVIEGLRTIERQKELVRRGASKTLNSRHLTGHAVDIVPWHKGAISWDWPLYHKLAPFVKDAAEELGVDLEWGGDWTTFKDGPHWQLSWNTYSKTNMVPMARETPVKAPDFTRPDVEPAAPPPAPMGFFERLRWLLWG